MRRNSIHLDRFVVVNFSSATEATHNGDHTLATEAMANDGDDYDMVAGNGSETELEVWQEVYSSLLTAIRKAQSGISESKAQRRFWLEEIEANLNDDGTLKSKSIWKRPAPLIRHTVSLPSSKSGGTGNRNNKRSMKQPQDSPSEKLAKKPRKKKIDSSKSQETDTKTLPGSNQKKKQPVKARTISVGKQLPPAVEAVPPAAFTAPVAPEDDFEDEEDNDETMIMDNHGSSSSDSDSTK